MFRAVVWTLRQRRYVALAIGMLLIALVCIGMGTFEIHRYQEKTHDNAVLRANARVRAVPLTSALVPLVGDGPAPTSAGIRYRTVTAAGRYLPAAQAYVASQIQGGRQGFYVLTPLRTPAGVLLVVRGFVPATSDETRPARIAAPPAGRVRLTGWLQTPQTSSDRLGQLGHREIRSINPGEQAARLGASTFNAYLTLAAHQPGTAGLTPVPRPGLSNPTGGAAEWQLLAYVVQWFAFAALALIAPFLFSRAEVREARRRFLGVDEAAVELDADAAVPAALAAGSSPDTSGGELAVRGSGALARRGESDADRWERAVRLADRYGRSLGPDAGPELARSAGAAPPAPRRAPVRNSAAAPHRSEDDYHGSYNDYLWQLALADGAAPAVEPPAAASDGPGALDLPEPRPIERDRSAPGDSH